MFPGLRHLQAPADGEWPNLGRTGAQRKGGGALRRDLRSPGPDRIAAGEHSIVGRCPSWRTSGRRRDRGTIRDGTARCSGRDGPGPRPSARQGPRPGRGRIPITATVELLEPYAPRRVSFLGLWARDEWLVKAYGIRYRGAAPAPALVEAARSLVLARLPLPARAEGRYGVGFAGVHEGRGANFVFADWWAEENELHHHVWISPSANPRDLVYRTPSGLAACVWDLAVIGFERQAWLDTVLANPSGPDVEAYLSRRLEGRV